MKMKDLSIASDYAVLHVGEDSFYYGYETAIDEDGQEWRFRAVMPESPIFTIFLTCEEIGLKDRFDVTSGLLLGIGAIMELGLLVPRIP